MASIIIEYEGLVRDVVELDNDTFTKEFINLDLKVPKLFIEAYNKSPLRMCRCSFEDVLSYKSEEVIDAWIKGLSKRHPRICFDTTKIITTDTPPYKTHVRKKYNHNLLNWFRRLYIVRLFSD